MNKDIFNNIEIELLSDTTFSSGYENIGSVDIEIDHDDLGLPMLSGKTLHGLLRDGCLSLSKVFNFKQEVIKRVFGLSKDNDEKSILRLSNARFKSDVIKWIKYAENKKNAEITSNIVLESQTSIRTQTSIDETTGAPKEGTLRFSRVANRGIKLYSTLTWTEEPNEEELKYLAIACLSVRHAGWERNRGRGHIKVTLNGDLSLTQRLAKGEIK